VSLLYFLPPMPPPLFLALSDFHVLAVKKACLNYCLAEPADKWFNVFHGNKT
jgi:hypothetical protein